VYAVQSVWPQDKIKQTIMSLKKAWYLMTEQKEIPYDYLRPVVADSWLRCLDANVHYTRRTAPLNLLLFLLFIHLLLIYFENQTFQNACSPPLLF